MKSIRLLVKNGQALAQAATATIETELQIGSPSQKRNDLGQSTGQGFGIGMLDEMGRVISNFQALIGATVAMPPVGVAPDTIWGTMAPVGVAASGG